MDELLTVGEVAIHLRVSTATVRKWCNTGALPAVRIGRQWRIRRVELDKFVKPEEGDEPKESDSVVLATESFLAVF